MPFLPTSPTQLLGSLAEIQRLPRYTHVSQTGVYFLFNQNDVVYVGQGQDILSRIGHHALAGKKQFDSYAYLPCPADQLNEAEAHFIHLLQPYYNKTIPFNDTYKSLPTIKRTLGVNLNVLKRYMQHQRLPLNQATYLLTDFQELRPFISWLHTHHPNVYLQQCPVYYWEQYLKTLL